MPGVILLTNGGMRSLAATAMVMSWPQAQRVTLLHVRRDQPARESRLSAVRRMAGHFTRCRLIEIDEPVVRVDTNITTDKKAPGTAAAVSATTPTPAKLPIMNLLTLALTQALQAGASRIIWPVSFNGEFSQITRAMEQTVLARHLAATEIDDPPIIECPMSDLSNRQIVELGASLNVPWDLSWSCDADAPAPCGQCAGCRRRHAAFTAAGVADPQAKAKAKGVRAA